MTKDTRNGLGGIKWCWPVLPMSGYSVQPGCGYLDAGYYEATRNPRGTGPGSVHCGCDLNGLGGGDSDLGDSIYAAADGVVVEASQHRVWGWTIVIRHLNVGGGYGAVETQYAHPEKQSDVLVKVGDNVRCGQVIARMGRGGYNASKRAFYFKAHLHFEVRTKLGLPGDEWPSTGRNRRDAEEYTIATRDDPVRFLEYMNAARSLEELATEDLVRPASAPVVVKPAPVIAKPAPVTPASLFDLSSVELLDQGGKYVPAPGPDFIYNGSRYTRVGSKWQVRPKGGSK